MSPQQREQMLDLNQRLCLEYNETEDPLVLEQIAMTESVLFNDPDHTPRSDFGDFGDEF